MPMTCCYSSAWTLYLTFTLLAYWAYEHFGTGTGPYNVHLHSVWHNEPPVTGVVQVHTARGMSLLVEGDSAIDENREICMISTWVANLAHELGCAAAAPNFLRSFLGRPSSLRAWVAASLHGASLVCMPSGSTCFLSETGGAQDTRINDVVC